MLHNLPPEILSIIFADLATAKDARSLSLCCRNLHRYVQAEGWRIFAKSRFPSIFPDLPLHISHAEASQALTGLSRSWDRKSVLARYLITPAEEREQSSGGWWRQRPILGRAYGATPSPPSARRQTMGFQPVIDSYEESTGSDWASRKEILAWAAGPQLVIRLREMGRDMKVSPWPADHQGHVTRWNTHLPADAKDGNDDITTLKLLRPPYVGDFSFGVGSSVEDVKLPISSLIGTASGKLSIVDLGFSSGDFASVSSSRSLETGDRSIRSAGVSLSPSAQFVVAVLANTTIALYDINSLDSTIQPIFQDIYPQFTRIWSSQFLSKDLLALGVGPSPEPLHVYGVRPTGLTEEPLRSWAAHPPEHTSNLPDELHSPFTSVFHTCPLTWDAQGGHSPGEVFLSGQSDGTARLHDMRSPADYESIYFDPLNDGGVYSLVALGRERLVAGNSRNSLLKLFDLRVSGGRMYSYVDARKGADTSAPPTTSAPRRSLRELPRRRPQKNYTTSNGWSVFLYPDRTGPPSILRGRNQFAGSWRLENSPVYSLSSPSPFSPTIYAGIEGKVAQIDVVSIFDKHPDPIFGTPPEDIGLHKLFWDPEGDLWDIAMYDHAETKKLWKQTKYWGSSKPEGTRDERWQDLSVQSRFSQGR